jgi:hypothetical protein
MRTTRDHRLAGRRTATAEVARLVPAAGDQWDVETEPGRTWSEHLETRRFPSLALARQWAEQRLRQHPATPGIEAFNARVTVTRWDEETFHDPLDGGTVHDASPVPELEQRGYLDLDSGVVHWDEPEDLHWADLEDQS